MTADVATRTSWETLDRWTYNPEVEAGVCEVGTPPSVPERRGLTLGRMAAQLRRAGVQRGRVAQCGAPLYPVRQQDGEVSLMARAGKDGGCRAYWSGIETCGSTWACPRCSMAIRAKRGQQVSAAVGKYGQARVRLLTVTIRHHQGQALKPLADGLQKAYSALQRGTPWKRWKAHVGLEHTVRGWEVTYGANGWHPHIHSLFFFQLSGEALDAVLHSADLRWGVVRDVGRGEFEWRKKPSQSAWAKLSQQGWSAATPWQWLVARWQSCVVQALGAEQRPDCLHGCDLAAVHDAKYLTKLGLELADVGGKKGRKPGSRTPMQIAEDVVAEPANSSHRALWCEFAAAFEGRRQLVWSQVPWRGVTASSYTAIMDEPEGSDDSLAAAAAVDPVEPEDADQEVSDELRESGEPGLVLSVPWPVYELFWQQGQCGLLPALLERGWDAQRLTELWQRVWRDGVVRPRPRPPLLIGPGAVSTIAA